MKQKAIYIALGAEAVLCVGLCLAQVTASGIFSAAAAFPFEQLGLLLRNLSELGSVANGGALLLYAAICLLPAGYLFIISSKRKLKFEDSLLGLLSAVLFAVMYLMINPAKIGDMTHMGSAGVAVGKAVLGGVVWSVLAGYAMLRLLRACAESGAEKLKKLMGAMLYVLAAVFVLEAFGAHFGAMLNNFSELKENNTAIADKLGLSYFFLVLRFFVGAMPWILDIATVFAAKRLLDAMSSDRYSEGTVETAKRLSKWCAGALSAVILTSVIFNVLQLVFSGALQNVNITLSLPVFSVAFVLAAFLLAKIIGENRQLKQDNDLFI